MKKTFLGQVACVGLGILLLAVGCGQSDMDGTWTLQESSGDESMFVSRFSISAGKYVPAVSGDAAPCEYNYFKTPTSFSVSTPKPANSRCAPVDQTWDLEEQLSVGKIVLTKEKSRAVYVRLTEKQKLNGDGALTGTNPDQLVAALTPKYKFTSRIELPVSAHTTYYFSGGTYTTKTLSDGPYCAISLYSDFYSIQSIPAGAQYTLTKATFSESSYSYDKDFLTIAFDYLPAGKDSPIGMQLYCIGSEKARITGTELEKALGGYFVF